MKPVKICGITSLEAIKATIKGKAGFIGFVFVKQSPRYLPPKEAKILSDFLLPQQKKIALLSDPTNKDIEILLQEFTPDYLQLHGKETLERVQDIHKTFSLPLIKAIAMETQEDVNVAIPFIDSVDMLLFDAKPPKQALYTGGHGKSFNWEILHSFQKYKKPYFVAGGIHHKNAKEALTISGANYIDLSSGVEREKGVKDPHMIHNLLQLF